MSTSKNAKLQFESGQTVVDYGAMTDSGDHKVHTVAGLVYSGKSGKAPIVRPNGIVSGRNVASTHVTNDTLTSAAFTAYSIGVLYSVSAAATVMPRPASDVAQILSLTMNSSGALAVVEGTESADTTLVETRGAAGGPPSIPADSIEVAQVRYSGSTPAVISADEIFQVVGTHSERFDYPLWDVNPVGDGDKAVASAQKNAYVEFNSAIPMIHGATATSAADLYKQTYIKYYAPIFVDTSRALDFSPADNSHSVSSVQVYNSTVGSVAETLGQGGFTALLTDNITDALLQEQDEVCTIKFFPDRNKAPFILTQGTLGTVRTFPVANQNQAVCTISSEVKSANFAT